MTLIVEYNKRQFTIDERTPTSCRVEVIDEGGRGNIYISRDDAKKAITELKEFLKIGRYYS